MTDYPKTFAGPGGTGAAMAKDSSIIEDTSDVSSRCIDSVTAVTEAVEREERIASLIERYRTGRYYVNSQTLAARIVDTYLKK